MSVSNVQQENLQGEDSIRDEHVHNNISVRNMLGQRGIKPEKLAVEEDLKKLERRVKSEERKIAKNTKKLPPEKNGDS